MKKRDYSKSKYTGNLLKEKEEMKKQEKRSLNKSVLFFLFIIILGGIVYWLFFSSFWNIKKVVIVGTSKLNEIKRLEEISGNFLNSRRFLILSQRNVFILSDSALKSVVNKSFDLEKVEVEIDKPNTLIITIKKKVPVLLWQEATSSANKDDLYFSIYNDGILAKEVKNWNEYNLPIVNRGTSTQVVIGDRYVSKKQAEFIKQIFDYFNYYFKNIKIKQFVVKVPESREVELITDKGWKIIFNIDSDPQSSLTVASRILNEKVEGNLEYIDMRIDGKVYYK